MEELQKSVQNLGSKNPLQNNIVYMFLVLCFVLLGVAAYEIRALRNKNLELVASTKNLQDFKNTPTDVSEKDTNIVTGDFRLYPSPNGKYILVLKTDPKLSTNNCNFDLYDNNGYSVWNVDLFNLLKIKAFSCDYGMFGLYSKEFLGWHDDKTLSFLIGDEIKNVILDDSVNISNNRRVITYPNPYKNLVPLAVNHQRDTFLFTDVSDNRLEDKIIVANLNSGGIVKELVFEKGSMGWPVFDYVNKGYVYTQRFFTEDSVETKIFFLSMNDLSPRLLLQDKQPLLGGRGCGPYRIKSQNKGEIIFDAGGCLLLDKKYFSNDGYLHLKLTNPSD